MTWTAFGPLATVDDLLGKLGRDLERMKADPDSIDPAFDFFVTARSMPDWRWPKSMAGWKEAREKAMKSSRDLEIVRDLGDQAKHYRITQRQPVVGGLGRTESAFDPSYFDRHAFQTGSIDIEIPGEPVIDAIDLAERVIDWWTKELPDHEDVWVDPRLLEPTE
jgi:hypothetical protein